jgi:hypothetical protein
VVALVIVLHDHLPIGRNLIVVLGEVKETLGGIRGDEVLERTNVVVERWPGAGRVHEHPAVPDLHRQLDEAVLGGIEAFQVTEAGCAHQPPV